MDASTTGVEDLEIEVEETWKAPLWDPKLHWTGLDDSPSISRDWYETEDEAYNANKEAFVSKGEELDLSRHRVICHRQIMQVEINCNLQLKDFPFDLQNISMELKTSEFRL